MSSGARHSETRRGFARGFGCLSMSVLPVRNRLMEKVGARGGAYEVAWFCWGEMPGDQ